MKLYGIAEIAEALGVPRQLVAQWHLRSSQGRAGGQDMPKPDQELYMGPVWYGRTIAPWIRKQRPLAKARAKTTKRRGTR